MSSSSRLRPLTSSSTLPSFSPPVKTLLHPKFRLRMASSPRLLSPPLPIPKWLNLPWQLNNPEKQSHPPIANVSSDKSLSNASSSSSSSKLPTNSYKTKESTRRFLLPNFFDSCRLSTILTDSLASSMRTRSCEWRCGKLDSCEIYQTCCVKNQPVRLHS